MAGATRVKERPILMSAPMVRATREGHKTQTRRVVVPTQSMPKVAPLNMEPWMINGYQEQYTDGRPLWTGYHPDYQTGEKWFACPYGQPGDRLWVRETWALVPRTAYACSDGVQQTLRPDDNHDAAVYRAGWTLSEPGRWRPSIHMPRWASRILLEIVDVRAEQIQNISEADARAEGVAKNWIGNDCPPEYANEWENYGADLDDFPCYSARDSFASLWDSINEQRGYSWAVNPWVWCISFKLLQPEVDHVSVTR